MVKHFMLMQDGPEIGSLANIIAGSSMHAGRLHIPCSSTQEVDKARIKTKEVYEGTWKASATVHLFHSSLVHSMPSTCFASH